MNKKVLILICVLVVCLLSLSLVACKGGAYEMKEFIVDFSKIANEYQVGDEVDLGALKITASFTDDTTETIPLDKVNIYLDGVEITADEALTKITETTGSKTLEIEYSTFKKSFVITVEEKHVPVLTGVRLDTTNVTTTSYDVGATGVSLAGLKVIGIYDQTIEQEVALDAADLKILMGEVIVTDLDQIAATVGDKTIKVRYGTYESENSLIITVNDVFDKIVITVDPTLKTAYKVGDTFSAAGKISAKEVMKSGAESAVTDIKYFVGDVEVTDFTSLFASKGSLTLTVKATKGGRTATKDIALTAENFITGIQVDTADVETLNFVAGDALTKEDFAGTKVNVVYADASDNTVLSLTSDGVSCLDASGNPINFTNLTNTAGEKTVVVSYAGKTASFTIEVADGESALDSLTIQSRPYASRTLTAGDSNVDFSDLVVKAVWKDEFAKADEDIAFADFAANGVSLFMNDEPLTDLANVTKVSNEGENTVTIAVGYNGKTASFTLSVYNGVTALAVDATGAKTSYLLDEEIDDFSGIVVTATLNYGTKTIAYADLEFYDGDTKVTDLSVFTNAASAARVVRVKHGAFGQFTIEVNDYVVGIETGAKDNFVCNVDLTPNAVYDFVANGLELFNVYYSGAKIAITDGYTFSDRTIGVPGTKTVTITANGMTDTVTLTVNDVLESIAVSNIPVLQYGATVNFTSLTVTGTYRYGGAKNVSILQGDGESFLYDVSFALKVNDEFDDLTQLELNTIAQASGVRTVKITVYGVSTTFDVTVEEPLPNISGYELASSFSTYNANRTYGAANQDKTSKAFESAFFVSDDDVYLVGDDNAFKFLPSLTQTNIETGIYTTLTSFKTDTKVFLGNEELTATDLGNNRKAFKKNDTLYVTESYTKNEYEFAPAALNQTLTLSVKPDGAAFGNAGDFNAVEWTFKVVDGFNVTDSRQLCVLEQSNRTYWNDIKAQLGLTGVKPNAIILHQNTMITKDSIPSSMYYTLPDNYNIKYKYTDDQSVEHSVKPEDVPAEYGGPFTRTFLWDDEWALFEYRMTSGSSFTIHGNFFDIDMSKMPLVAAFEPNGVSNIPAGMDTYYGAYMSKTSFLEVRGVEGTVNAADETFNFSNFAVKGNAGVQMVTVDPSSSIARGGDSPVMGGGLIFVKSRYCHSNITNIHAHACFIPFFSRNETVVNYTNVKAYDSFQNALFVHSDSVNNLVNCHMKRAGGPLMILTQGEKDLGGGNYQPLIPKVYADNDCVLESYVTGQSQWFVTYGVTGNVMQLAGLDPLLQGYFHKSLQSDGKFDVITVSVEDGGGGTINTQSYFEYMDSELDRLDGDAVFETIKALKGMGFPTFFVASDGSICMPYTTDNEHYSLVYFTGSGIEDVSTNSSLMASFTSSDYIVIIAEGMGILTNFFEV